MKQNSLNGLGIVFKHNFKINMKSTKYIISTVIVSLVFMLGIFALVFFLTNLDNKTNGFNYNVKEVYVVDESGIGYFDYDVYASQLGNEEYTQTRFIEAKENAEELIEKAEVEYMIIQTLSEKGYSVKIVTGKNVDASSGQTKKNLDVLQQVVEQSFQMHKLSVSGLTQGQIVQVLVPAATEIKKIGEENVDEGKHIVEMLVTMLFVFFIYFIVLIYGPQISSDVPMEKTSKLVEQMLMTVSPYALLTGKVTAMVCSCVIQFVIWILSIIVGIFGSDLITKLLLGCDGTVISTLMDSIRTWFEGDGFNIASVILMILLAVSGLVFYLLLAGFAGATLSKPEESANVQMIFVLPLIISFFLVLYTSGLSDGAYNPNIIYNFIPFTGAMTAPAAAVTGSMSTILSLACLGVHIIFDAVLLWMAAKVYEGLLFFKGNKVKLVDIVEVLKR